MNKPVETGRKLAVEGSDAQALKAAIEWAEQELKDETRLYRAKHWDALITAARQSRTAPNADLKRAAELLREHAMVDWNVGSTRLDPEMIELASRLEAMQEKLAWAEQTDQINAEYLLRIVDLESQVKAMGTAPDGEKCISREQWNAIQPALLRFADAIVEATREADRRVAAPEHEKLIAEIKAIEAESSIEDGHGIRRCLDLLAECRTALSADTKTIKGDQSCGSDDHAAAFPSANGNLTACFAGDTTMTQSEHAADTGKEVPNVPANAGSNAVTGDAHPNNASAAPADTAVRQSEVYWCIEKNLPAEYYGIVDYSPFPVWAIDHKFAWHFSSKEQAELMRASLLTGGSYGKYDLRVCEHMNILAAPAADTAVRDAVPEQRDAQRLDWLIAKLNWERAEINKDECVDFHSMFPDLDDCPVITRDVIDAASLQDQQKENHGS